MRIAALDAVAARMGLHIGASLTEARAICPDLDTAPANREADAEALREAATDCEIFTPLVALQGEDGLIIDITGCAHLFDGEHTLLRRARHRLARSGFTCSAAIAGTPEAAWALSRYRRGTVIPPDGHEAIIRGLPIKALDQTGITTLALNRAGFRTLGDLADRPTHLLSARFGTELVTSLQRILGREDIRITPVRAPPEIMAEKHFAEPLATMDSLLLVLDRLAGDIMQALDTRGMGGRAFEARFFRSDGVVRHILVETARGTREAGSLMRLIRLRIEALADPIDPGFGFDALRLSVLHSEPLAPGEPVLTGEPEAEGSTRSVTDLIDRLVARFGRENVRRFNAHDTHDPARAGETIPYLSRVSSAVWPEPDPGHPPLRPLTLFTRPQWIEVMAEVPDAPPLRFRWRRVLHEVTHAEGPERIAPEWWREATAAPATYDYYRVEDANGHRFWIFREGLYAESSARPRWFLHGLFA